MNYVKFYKQSLNIDFDSSKFEVHHIDQDRSNNDIENLLLLPKELHHQYHRLKPSKINLTIDIVSVVDGSSGSNDYLLETIIPFIRCWKECCKWKDYKYYLLGVIPNIHNINLDKG